MTRPAFPALATMLVFTARAAAALRARPSGVGASAIRAVASGQQTRVWRGLDEPAERKARWNLPTADATANLGRSLARACMPGDVILLTGDVGAGKSTLARGFLKEFFQDEDLVVSSPSYLIDIAYDDPEGAALVPGVTVHHMDLWRVGPGQIQTLVDLDEAYARAVCLVEWPERFGDAAPAAGQCLQVRIEPVGAFAKDVRKVKAKAKPLASESDSFVSAAAAELEELGDQPRCATLTTFADSWSTRIEHMMTENMFHDFSEHTMA